MPPAEDTRHATAVAVGSAGILIIGPSGSGKSGLALQLIALGASLVADDRVTIHDQDGWPWLRQPPRLQGVIEARHVGLIKVSHVASAPLRLIVDMQTPETERLPERRSVTVHGQAIGLVRRVDAPHFPASILALMRGGVWQ